MAQRKKIINPLTGHRIQVGGATYKALAKKGILRGGGNGNNVKEYQEIIMNEGGLENFYEQKLTDLRKLYGQDPFPLWWQDILPRLPDWNPYYDDRAEVTIGDLVSNLDFDSIPREYFDDLVIYDDFIRGEPYTLDQYEKLYKTIKKLE